MGGKFSRSWHLIKSSARVLSSEPDLAIIPIVGITCTAAAVSAIYFGIAEPLGLGDIYDDRAATDKESQLIKAEHFIVLFLLYLSTSFISTFFSVALAHAALSRLRGGSGGFGSGLARAVTKLWPIFGYSALFAALGLVQKFLSDRGGAAGRAASGVIGVASGIATFLVSPIIAEGQVGRPPFPRLAEALACCVPRGAKILSAVEVYRLFSCSRSLHLRRSGAVQPCLS